MAKANAHTEESAEDVLAQRIARAKEAEATRVDYTQAEPVNEGPVPALEARRSAPLAVVNRSTMIEDEDMVLPRLSLGQAISRAVQNDLVKGGEWYLNLDTEVLGKRVEIVPLSYRKHRALFVQGQGLACRSYDMVVGVGAPGGDCDTCPLKDWVVDPETRKTISGPKCRINYDFVVLARTAGTDDPLSMCLVSLSGTGASEAKKFITSKVNRWGKDGPWYKDYYLLSSERQDGAKGIYHKATITRIGATPAELVAIAEDRLGSVTAETVTKSVDSDDEAA